MNRYTNSYTRVVIDKTRISRRKFKGRICHNCKKIFPSKELCYNHYKRKLCKKRKNQPQHHQQQLQHHFYKCNICGAYYEMYSILQRHMREHAYMKRIGKKLGISGLKNTARLRGGGSPSQRRQRQRQRRRRGEEGEAGDEHSIGRNNVDGPSSSRQRSPSLSSNDENDNVPLMHLTQQNNEPVLPARWGWTTHILTLNTSDFDSELLSKLMLAEIKSEISERKKIIRHEHDIDATGNTSNNDNDDDDNDDNDSSNEDLENDERFFTLSMIATLKVYFYKLDLGTSLGKNNQTTKVKVRTNGGEHDDNETLVNVYFHSSSVRLFSEKLKKEIHLIIDNFK